MPALDDNLVIDASALIAVVFGEPEGEAIRERCRSATLIAPQLLDYEVANICLVKQRRDPDMADKLARQFAAFQLLELQRLPVHIGEVHTLAAQTRLTAYDAAYLWLALQHNCPLVTLDNALNKAMQIIRLQT